jgi:hypothetical protein
MDRTDKGQAITDEMRKVRQTYQYTQQRASRADTGTPRPRTGIGADRYRRGRESRPRRHASTGRRTGPSHAEGPGGTERCRPGVRERYRSGIGMGTRDVAAVGTLICFCIWVRRAGAASLQPLELELVAMRAWPAATAVVRTQV